MNKKEQNTKGWQMANNGRLKSPASGVFAIMPIILSYLLFIVFASSCNLSKKSESLEEQLNGVITPLKGSSPSLDNSDLQVLAHLGNAQIVGLGEATHGTREFFQMKHRVFKYLVEEHGFKVFAFEADFAECIYFDNYIKTGEGNLEQLMREKMYFWTWRTEEVRDLLEWMKNYNVGKSPDEMLHFIGVDSQTALHSPGLITEYLEWMAPDLLVEAAPWLAEPIKAGYEYFDTLMDRLDARAAAGNLGGTKRDYDITRQLIRVLSQTCERKANDSDPAIRDKFMGENTLWIREFLGHDIKIAAWAHNGHISKTGYGDLKNQGMYISEALGDGYKTVGFGFSTGEFTALSEADDYLMTTCIMERQPELESYNKVFHEAKYENFIFNFSDAVAGSKLDDWIHSEHTFFFLGAVFTKPGSEHYYPLILADHFDTLIYFDVSTASRILEL